MITIDLSGRGVIVTGGGQGLGAAIVRALHRAGASVAINFFPDPAGANQGTAEDLAAELGERSVVVGADVRRAEQVRAMVDQAGAQFARLDILVNNAGIMRDRTLKNLSSADWQDVIDTNLTGVFHCCQSGRA